MRGGIFILKEKMLKKSIQGKLILSIFGIGLLGIAAGLSIIYFIGRDSIRQSIGDSFMKLASLTSDKLELSIDHHIEESLSFGSSVNLLTVTERYNKFYQDKNEGNVIKDVKAIEERWSNIDEEDRVLSEILNNNASLYMRNYERQHDNINIIDRGVHYNIIATDIMGKVTAALNKPSHYYYGDKVWWKSAYNNGNGRVYLSDIEYDDDLKAYTFGIAAPIMDGNKVIGVLYMIHNVDIFFRWVTSIKVGETDHTMLASSDGVLLFCPIFPIRSHSLHPELREEIFKDKPGWGVTVNDVHYKGEAINGYAPVGITVSFGLNNFGGKRWYIFTSQNPEETYSPINKLFKWILISGFMGLGVLSVLGLVVTKKIVITPIKELKRGAELIGEGNLDYNIYVDTGDEIEDLASEFNKMAKKLKKSYTGLEEMVEDRTKELEERTRELEVRNKEFFLLYSITSTIFEPKRLEGLLDDTSNKILGVMKANIAVVCLKDRTGIEMRIKGLPDNFPDKGKIMKFCEYLNTLVIKEEKTVYIDDILSQIGIPERYKDIEMLSLACIPIRSIKRIFGSIIIFYKKSYYFSLQRKEIFSSIGQQLGTVIENNFLNKERAKK
ncbi:MAG: HAMP domain-containing protein [Nitrospirota bacterium]